MNKQNLILKMAENLGVSRTQKDLAFKIFIDKVTSLLNYGEAIKIPEIGVFQLKKEPVVAGNSGHNVGSRIIFSPAYSASEDEKLSLFLTIDVEEYNRVGREYTDKIFSLGIGKPLIPVSNTAQGNVATEELYIQKSIQERINDLLARSEKLEKFDLWDDYLSEKTVNEAPTFEPDLSESISNEKMDKTDEEIIDKILDAENENNIEPLKDYNETENEKENENHNHNENLKDFDEIQAETENEKLIFDESNLLVDIEQTDLQKEYNELIKKAEEEKGSAEKEITAEDKITNDESDEFFENKTLDEETASIDDEKVESEKPEAEQEELNTPEKEFRPERQAEVQPEFEERGYSRSNQKNDNTFWYILGAFIFVTLAGLYYFVIDTGNNVSKQVAGDVTNERTVPNNTTTNGKQPAEKPPVVKQQNTTVNPTPEKSVPVKKAEITPPVETKAKKNVAVIGNNSPVGKEQEVEDLIFYNGKYYAVQVSSWKNKNSAEKAAGKFRNRGYDTEVVSADLGPRGTWYRVRITKINSLDKARKIKKSFIR